MSPLAILTILLSILASCFTLQHDPQANPEVSTEETQITPHYGFTWNRYTVLATATATVVVVAGIVATASLLLPLITYKICYLLGGCTYGLNTYVDQFIATDGHPRQKRDAEYFGPILQTLAAAYEKYSDDPKKKLERLSSFVR